MTMNRARVALLSCGLAVGVATALYVLDDTPPRASAVRFCAPQGYIGPIVVVAQSGAPTPQIRDGLVSIDVPSDGVVWVGSIEFMINADVTIRFPDGTEEGWTPLLGYTSRHSTRPILWGVESGIYRGHGKAQTYYFGRAKDAESFRAFARQR